MVDEPKEGYGLIPLDEIDPQARELAVMWGDAYHMDIQNKHKLASDIMNYAEAYYETMEENRKAKNREKRKNKMAIFEKTPEQIAQEEALKAKRRRMGNFKRELKALCKKEGLRSVELKLEHLKNFPETKLQDKVLTYEDTVSCYELAIQEYKEQLEDEQKERG